MFGTGQAFIALNVARIVAAKIAAITHNRGTASAAAGALRFHVRVKLWFGLRNSAYTISHQHACRPVWKFSCDVFP